MPFLSGERIAFSYLTSQKFTGDIATLDILREGKPMQLQIQVGPAAGQPPMRLATIGGLQAAPRCRRQERTAFRLFGQGRVGAGPSWQPWARVCRPNCQPIA